MLFDALEAVFFALLFSMSTFSKPFVPLPRGVSDSRVSKRGDGGSDTTSSPILSPRQSNTNCTSAGEPPHCDSNPRFAALKEPCSSLLTSMKFHDSVRPAGSRTIDNCWLSWDESSNINPTYGDLVQAVSGMLSTCWTPDGVAQSARIPLISVNGNCTTLCVSNRPEGCLL